MINEVRNEEFHIQRGKVLANWKSLNYSQKQDSVLINESHDFFSNYLSTLSSSLNGGYLIHNVPYLYSLLQAYWLKYIILYIYDWYHNQFNINTSFLSIGAARIILTAAVLLSVHQVVASAVIWKTCCCSHTKSALFRALNVSHISKQRGEQSIMKPFDNYGWYKAVRCFLYKHQSCHFVFKLNHIFWLCKSSGRNWNQVSVSMIPGLLNTFHGDLTQLKYPADRQNRDIKRYTRHTQQYIIFIYDIYYLFNMFLSLFDTLNTETTE